MRANLIGMLIVAFVASFGSRAAALRYSGANGRIDLRS